MRNAGRSAVVLLAVLCAAGAARVGVAQVVEPAFVEEAVHPGAAPTPAPLRLADSASLVPIEALGFATYSEPAKLQELSDWNRSGSIPPKNGFSRQLSTPRPISLGPGLLLPGLTPQPLAGGLAVRALDGQITWGAKVQVDGAYRLRLHLAQVDLPPDSKIWVYGGGGESVGPVDVELLEEDGRIWTPSVGGPVIHLEIVIPQAASTATPHFTIDQVVEIFQLDSFGQPVFISPPEFRGTECLIDAQCVNAGTFDAIEMVQQAIAHLQFVDGGSSFICTGGLLNDMDDTTVIPYLLTANHCFSTQASTTSLEAYWDYYTSSCMGVSPPLGTLPKSLGGTLLATNASSDFTFVQLTGIPSNRVLLGWDASPTAVGTSDLHRVSHPLGEPQHYSMTVGLLNPSTCAGLPIARYLYSMQSADAGGTAGGSSGAPVTLDGGYVVGQLLGSCGLNPSDPCDPSNNQVDGRFSETYVEVAQYLDPQAATYTLSVAKSGTGSGTVTSDPGAIDCGVTCSDDYAEGTVVALTATPDVDAVFVGWSGSSDCSDGEVTMDANKNCLATFDLKETLSISKAGTGSGTVTSDPAGIQCGADCSEAYAPGTVVALTATPDGDSAFIGWSGSSDCSDGEVTMDANKNCLATFDLKKILEVSKIGSGTGTVTSVPAGILCGGDCSEAYAPGTVVALTATPDGDSVFWGWSGSSDCADGQLTMDANRNCTATFNLANRTLDVSKAGSGTGTVTSNPPGIFCGADCSEDYLPGTVVELTATPEGDSLFGDWSGDADCSDGSVTMTSNISCTATFNLPPMHLLSVSKVGNGTGTVSSTPAGISCGADCDEAYLEDTEVRLAGIPSIGSELTSWTGDADCSDGQLTMSSARSCTATFNICSSQNEFSLENTPVTTNQVVSACNYVYAGPNVQVTGTGELEIHAGNGVVLYDGFEVQLDGEMKVIVGQPMP